MGDSTENQGPEHQRAALKNTREIEVTWGDCDAAGVVFYPRFYAYFDTCTHSLLSSAGLDHHTLRGTYGLLGTPLVKASAEFLSPATYGDILTATSTLSNLGGKSFKVSHHLSIGERIVALGEEIRVWAIEATDAPHRMRAIKPDPRILAQLSQAKPL